MIISHKYKFIFIKTYKTAGTSLEIFLSHVCAPEDIVTPIGTPGYEHHPRNYRGVFNPLPETLIHLASNRRMLQKSVTQFISRKKFYNHIPAYLIKARVSKDVWNSYFKFSIERNPWDKTLSWFWMKREGRGSVHTFDEFIKNRKFLLNFPKYTDGKTRSHIIIDRIIQYETLSQELAEIFQTLGVPFSGSLDVFAKSGFRQNRQPYQEIYTDEQRKIVSHAFKKEIEIHGYSFD